MPTPRRPRSGRRPTQVTARIAERRSLLDAATDELREAVDADAPGPRGGSCGGCPADAEAAARASAPRVTAATAVPARRSASGGSSAATTAAPAATPVAAPAPSASTGGARAVEVALAQQGKPYRWAASGPGSFDCSGLVMYAYAAAGRSLPHSSRSLRSMTANIGAGDLQPGDLVFGGSPVHHVGIYIGNGQMVHAPSSGDVVKVSSIYTVTRKVSFGRL